MAAASLTDWPLLLAATTRLGWLCLSPGAVGLVGAALASWRWAVPGAIGGMFLLRGIVLAAFVALPEADRGPGLTAEALILLAGLLAGLSAEAALAWRPPPPREPVENSEATAED